MSLIGRLSVAIVGGIVLSSAAWAGDLLKNRTVPSPALNGALSYSVFLPDGYAADDARYPVVYLLHGFGGGQGEWIARGKVEALLDRMIADGEIAPLIAVMPEAGKSWYVNSARFCGPGDYETAIARDLVGGIDRAYRTQARAGARAIAGSSMGGFGALRLAFLYPETFSAVAALSPGVFKPGTFSWERRPDRHTPEDLEKWYPTHSESRSMSSSTGRRVPSGSSKPWPLRPIRPASCSRWATITSACRTARRSCSWISGRRDSSPNSGSTMRPYLGVLAVDGRGSLPLFRRGLEPEKAEK